MQKVQRLPSVIERTGLSRSSIYLRVSRGDFPKPIALGERAVGWLEEDVSRWLEDRIAQSRKAA
jgi:prophage regulatory protein